MYAIDVDGVVADFAHGFSLLLYTLDGKDRLPIVTDNKCKAWNWNEWYAMDEIGRDELKKLIERAWEDNIKTRVNAIWSNLTPLFPETMEQLNKNAKDHPVVFMTRRDGPGAWQETSAWLARWGVENPMVYIVKPGEEKSVACKKMGIDTIIDDSPVYAQELIDNDIMVIMPKWEYNKTFRTIRKGHFNLLAVETLKEALSIVDIMKERY